MITQHPDQVSDQFSALGKLSLTKLSKRINLPLEEWRRDLYTPAELILNKCKIPGIIEEGFIAKKANDGAVQYIPDFKYLPAIPCNWIKLANGCILDVYNWIYENVEPTSVLYVTESNDLNKYKTTTNSDAPRSNIRTFKPVLRFSDSDFPGKFELWYTLHYGRYIDINQLYWLLNHKNTNILGEAKQFIHDLTVENNYQRYMSSATFLEWLNAKQG